MDRSNTSDAQRRLAGSRSPAEVQPRHAVYVDGYYVGTVDDFDGAFQKLRLTGGRHTVEIRAEGFETIELDVRITPEKTVSFTEKMKKLQ